MGRGNTYYLSRLSLVVSPSKTAQPSFGRSEGTGGRRGLCMRVEQLPRASCSKLSGRWRARGSRRGNDTVLSPSPETNIRPLP
ncbi:hypothetical protein MUK42_37737 [Musa troglodytarum]|uniref:Uncharacterized protein n=1 Tax=Musa troglodytarum TaxID=320322 RepID=A0A9E7G1W7_9LILI|nr:hypothetical protein MUK42_37737 [Musa troglodytarum]